MGKGKIPISEAKSISERFRCPMVLIFAIDAAGDSFSITTYGQSKALCRHAASFSEQIAEAVLNGDIVPLQDEPTHLPDSPSQFQSAPKGRQ